MMQVTDYKSITLNDQQVPTITGTKMKGIELVTGQLVHGWSPEELHFQHPYLSMSQIHSALQSNWLSLGTRQGFDSFDPVEILALREYIILK